MTLFFILKECPQRVDMFDADIDAAEGGAK